METLITSPAKSPAFRGKARQPDLSERAFAILTLAFAGDPPCRWLFPDAQQYLENFPAFARAFGGAALAHGTALANGGSAALWLPPGAQPDEEALTELVQQNTSGEMRSEAFALFAEMGRVHPSEPHWYLPLIGVEPALQGRGCGAALIRPILEHCDAEELPAYLEATSPRNRALYERLGFDAVGLIQVGSCPAIVPMLRRPQ